MYGGVATKEYIIGCLDLARCLTLGHVGHTWLVEDNESLIPRGRNTLAARFMRDPELAQYEALIFIDADIQFRAEDVIKLWNLGVPVATACYAMKRDNGGVTAWKDGRPVDPDSLSCPTAIDYACTGFLMIRRQVFTLLQDAHPEARHVEHEIGECYDLFPCGVTEEDKWRDRFYRSEDYGFCAWWRQLGGEIILDPSIKLGHVGKKIYR